MIDLVVYFLVGMVAAFLGSLSGTGGGFMAVPALYYLGLPPPSAIATSKFMVFINSIVSIYAYLRDARFSPKLYFSVAASMTPMAYLGAYLVAVIPQRLLVVIVSMILLVGSLRLLLMGDAGRNGRSRGFALGRRPHILGAASGGAAGLIAGLTGLGGGIVTVPAFIYLMNLEIHSSVSLSMACIAPSSFSSVIRHAVDGIILWDVAVPLGAGAVLGGWIGPKISLRLSERMLGKMVGALIAAAALRMLIQVILEI
ncbi:MAG: sulfite exporter TauE/SafE family protein [Nitrososphaeria archaeon]|nr:sulfite exporter TauE/SafE family protein [Nitrososphaeria archaeon]